MVSLPRSLRGIFYLVAVVLVILFYQLTITLLGWVFAGVLVVLGLWLLYGIIIRIHRHITGG